MIAFVSLLKNAARNIVLAAIMVFNLLSVSLVDAQQFMSLGSLKFVLSDENTSMDSRTIRMKMALGSNSSLNFNLVGGVAFMQQAIPDFNVRKMDLYYSSEDNKAHLKINRKDIIIPLEMFELQPIVNFANSEDEVVVTLYGALYGAINNCESQNILFHPAFIDNLMGLRLLQVDALTMLDGTNGEFPIINNSTICMTTSEIEKYFDIENQLAAKGSNYSDDAYKAFQEIKNIFHNDFISYIYTDLNQPIHFSIVNNSISFVGLPYYEFSHVMIMDMDPMLCYYSIKQLYNDFENKGQDFIESQSEQASKPKTLIEHKYYKYVQSIMVKNILENKETDINDIVSFEDYYDNEYYENKAYYDTMRYVAKEYYENLFKSFAEIVNQQDKTDEQKADEFIQRIQTGYNKLEMSELAEAIQLQLAEKYPKQVVNDVITNHLKERHDLVRRLNPIVYQEVDDICQWAALFRYIKTNKPSAWGKFVTQVNEIKPDAPSVKTPIYRIQ